jgi:hypothetical protein
MKRALNVLLFMLITCPLTADEHQERHLSQCGINSLYACLTYLNVEDDFNVMYSNIRTDQENKVNLYQIAKYAEKRGLYFKPILKPTIEKIDAFLNEDSAAILQYHTVEHGVKNAHIIALIRFNKEIKVLDFPRAFIVERDNLAKGLENSGGILIISKKPFPWEMNITTLFLILILCSLALAMYLLYNKFMKNKRLPTDKRVVYDEIL